MLEYFSATHDIIRLKRNDTSRGRTSYDIITRVSFQKCMKIKYAKKLRTW